jgi:hypothetical protein
VHVGFPDPSSPVAFAVRLALGWVFGGILARILAEAGLRGNSATMQAGDDSG